MQTAAKKAQGLEGSGIAPAPSSPVLVSCTSISIMHSAWHTFRRTTYCCIVTLQVMSPPPLLPCCLALRLLLSACVCPSALEMHACLGSVP